MTTSKDDEPSKRELKFMSQIAVLESRVSAQFSIFALLGSVFRNRTPAFLDEFVELVKFYRDEQSEESRNGDLDGRIKSALRAEEAHHLLKALQVKDPPDFRVIDGGKKEPDGNV